MYPVERQHKFPSEAPKREKSAGADELKYPVMGVEKKHAFKDTAPAAYKIEKLQGKSPLLIHLCRGQVWSKIASKTLLRRLTRLKTYTDWILPAAKPTVPVEVHSSFFF